MKELKSGVKLFIGGVLLLIATITILQALENKNYNDVMKKCNNQIEIKHTSTGDKYYICKVNE